MVLSEIPRAQETPINLEYLQELRPNELIWKDAKITAENRVRWKPCVPYRDSERKRQCAFYRYTIIGK